MNHDSKIYEGIEEMNLPLDLQGWNSSHPVFENLIVRCNPKTIIEVGSWKGASACNMAMLAPDARIICIDTWLGGLDHYMSDLPQDAIPKLHGYPQIYFQFISNVKKMGFHNRITPLVQTSINAAKFLTASGINADLIYIDGSHEFEDVCNDIVRYFPLADKIIFGDDFKFSSVRAAVERMLPMRDIEVIDGNFWVYDKTTKVIKT